MGWYIFVLFSKSETVRFSDGKYVFSMERDLFIHEKHFNIHEKIFWLHSDILKKHMNVILFYIVLYVFSWNNILSFM